jgi:hypothetical protein
MIAVDIKTRHIEHGHHMFKVTERQIAAADNRIDLTNAVMDARCLQIPDYFIANRKEPHRTPKHRRALAPDPVSVPLV